MQQSSTIFPTNETSHPPPPAQPASLIIENPEKLRAGRRAGLAVVNEGIDAVGQREHRTGNDDPIAEGQREIGRPLNPILIIRRRAPPEYQVIGPVNAGDGDAGNGQRLRYRRHKRPGDEPVKFHGAEPARQ